MLEHVAISYSREFSQPRNQTCISWTFCISKWILHHCDTQEAHLCNIENSIICPSQGVCGIEWDDIYKMPAQGLAHCEQSQNVNLLAFFKNSTLELSRLDFNFKSFQFRNPCELWQATTIFFFFLATPHSLWDLRDLSSPARDWTQVLGSESES